MPFEIIALKKWIKTLPASGMVFPLSIGNRIKYFFWKLYTPLHPWIRDTATALGIVKRPGKQNFFLGKLSSASEIKEFIKLLLSRGFGNHFVAWKDEGELASLRHVKDFMHQYHVRIFEDGEVRGHYEYTPEYRPLLHLKAIAQEERREDFRRLIGEVGS